MSHYRHKHRSFHDLYILPEHSSSASQHKPTNQAAKVRIILNKLAYLATDFTTMLDSNYRLHVVQNIGEENEDQ